MPATVLEIHGLSIRENMESAARSPPVEDADRPVWPSLSGGRMQIPTSNCESQRTSYENNLPHDIVQPEAAKISCYWGPPGECRAKYRGPRMVHSW